MPQLNTWQQTVGESTVVNDTAAALIESNSITNSTMDGLTATYVDDTIKYLEISVTVDSPIYVMFQQYDWIHVTFSGGVSTAITSLVIIDNTTSYVWRLYCSDIAPVGTVFSILDKVSLLFKGCR